VQADHVAFGIVYQGDETVLADGEFFLEDFAAVLHSARGFDGAIGAGEVDEDGVTRWTTIAGHLDECSWATWEIAFHRECKHLNYGGIERLQFHSKNGLVKALCPGEVVDVDFKPTDWITFWSHDGKWLW
jgi:hypothetical protein